MTASAPRTISADGIDICTQSFGSADDPGILLINGASASMLWWDEALCERLAAGGYHVIRFDNRDTGRSTSYPVGAPPYTLADMAADSVAVLDAYGINSAHVMGRSMGGMISQHIALNHPQRVQTMTLIFSSPEGGSATGGSSELPGPTPELIAATTAQGDGDPVENRVALHRVLAGSRYEFDADKARALTVSEMERASSYASNANHTFVIRDTPPWRDRLATIKVPTLVVHGTEDPILPFAHGQALVSDIAGAKLFVMEGVGHALPVGEWDRLVEALFDHIRNH